jgi:hypothetical protein
VVLGLDIPAIVCLAKGPLTELVSWLR